MAVVATAICVCALAVSACGSSAVTASTQSTAVEEVATVDGPAGAERASTAYIDTTGKVIWQGE
jgi:hypothetical protein